MRVLHVIPSVSQVHGGPSRAIEQMERALTARGVDVTTLTTDDDGEGRRLAQANQIAGGGGARRYYARKATEFYKASPDLARWLTRHVRDYDILHIHALFSFSSTVAGWIARRQGVPYIVRPLGTLAGYGFANRRPGLKKVSFMAIERGLIANAAAVHFTSQSEWDEARGLGVAMRGAVVPLGIDVALSLPKRGAGPYRASGAALRVLYLSRLDPKKNVEGLIAAFASIHRRHRGVEFVIAGDGEANYVQSLKQRASDAGLADVVAWTGHISGARKSEALLTSDLFVLPSFSENFGIAAAEALAHGLPCVLSEGVAIARDAGDAGAALVTSTDPIAIEGAIVTLLDDGALRLRMGSAAHALALKEYSTETMGRRLIDLYGRVIASRATGAA